MMEMSDRVNEVTTLLNETRIELVCNGFTDSQEIAKAAGTVTSEVVPQITEIIRVLIGAELVPEAVDAPKSLKAIVERIHGLSQITVGAGAAMALPLELATMSGISVDELKQGAPQMERALFLIQQSLVALGAAVLDSLRTGEKLGLWNNTREGYGVSGFILGAEGDRG
jgi:hypothetical protein